MLEERSSGDINESVMGDDEASMDSDDSGSDSDREDIELCGAETDVNFGY